MLIPCCKIVIYCLLMKCFWLHNGNVYIVVYCCLNIIVHQFHNMSLRHKSWGLIPVQWWIQVAWCTDEDFIEVLFYFNIIVVLSCFTSNKTLGRADDSNFISAPLFRLPFDPDVNFCLANGKHCKCKRKCVNYSL